MTQRIFYVFILFLSSLIICQAFRDKQIVSDQDRISEAEQNQTQKYKLQITNYIQTLMILFFFHLIIDKLIVFKSILQSKHILTLMLFLFSMINFIRVLNTFQFKKKYFERQLQMVSQQCSQQIENIQNILKSEQNQVPKQHDENLYTLYSKKEKFFFKIFNLNEFIIAQRIIKFEDTLPSDKNIKQFIFIRFIEFLKSFLFKKYLSPPIKQINLSESKNYDQENQQSVYKLELKQLKQLPNTYEDIVKHIENCLIQLLNNKHQLKFNKIKYYGSKKFIVNDEIKIAIYMCVEKIENIQQKELIRDETFKDQIEAIITSFMQIGLKIQTLKYGQDFFITKNKQIVLNPCLILKHDPQISNSYFIHAYKQLCLQLNQQINQEYIQNIQKEINSIQNIYEI